MAKKALDPAFVDQFYMNGIYMPTRTLYLGSNGLSEDGGIDDRQAEGVIKALHVLDSMSNDPIHITINTPGGDVYAGLAIYDAIKLCHSPIVIKATGICMSMGTVILQAGDIRTSTPNTRFMMHLGMEGYGLDHPLNVRRWVDENAKVANDNLNIYLDKIRQKIPEFTKKKLHKLITFDKILRADEMIELGLLDEIEKY